MISFMRSFVLVVSLALGVISIAPARGDTFQQILNGTLYSCTSVGQPAQTCAQNCVARTNTGVCYQYGSDYCAAGPTACVAHCIARTNTGVCYQYAADVCGSDQVSCVQNCTARTNTGVCYEYAADSCG